MHKIIFMLVTIFLCISVTSTTSASPEFVRASKNIFAHPHDLEIDPSGQWLFVADPNNHDVKVLDANSLELVATIGSGSLNSPHDVHFDADGRLLVADSGNDRLVIYQLNKFQATQIDELNTNMSSPEGVTSSPDGHIFVASTGNHKILKFHNNRLVKEVGERGNGKLEFDRPHDVELGPDGLLYVGDPGNRRIQVLTDSLTYHSRITNRNLPFREPKYLALDKENQLYVADQGNNQLRIFNSARGQIESIKMAGELQLNHIEGAEVSGGKIWVSDTYNDRVVLFNWEN